MRGCARLPNTLSSLLNPMAIRSHWFVAVWLASFFNCSVSASAGLKSGLVHSMVLFQSVMEFSSLCVHTALISRFLSAASLTMVFGFSKSFTNPWSSLSIFCSIVKIEITNDVGILGSHWISEITSRHFFSTTLPSTSVILFGRISTVSVLR